MVNQDPTCTARRSSVLVGVILALCTLLLPLSSLAQDDTDQVSPGDGYYQSASDAAQHRRYQEAVDLLFQAIQAEPDNPIYYVGMGRMAFYAEDFDLATYYFDIYLLQFPDYHQSRETRRHNRESAVLEERTDANYHRESSDLPVLPPPDQMAALQAFEQRLATGPQIAPNRSGAYALYETLLRTRYAEPHLGELRQQLAEGIIRETNAMLWPTPNNPIPPGDGAYWASIEARYETAAELGESVLELKQTLARIAAAQGQGHVLNTNWEYAVQSFQEAIELDPGLLLARWGLILALYHRSRYFGSPIEGSWFAHLDTLESLTESQAPEHLNLVHVLEGALYASMGQNRDAAAVLLEILAPDHDIPDYEPPSRAEAEPASRPTEANEDSELNVDPNLNDLPTQSVDSEFEVHVDSPENGDEADVDPQ